MRSTPRRFLHRGLGTSGALALVALLALSGIAAPILAAGATAPSQVTVTLVRWPYT